MLQVCSHSTLSHFAVTNKPTFPNIKTFFFCNIYGFYAQIENAPKNGWTEIHVMFQPAQTNFVQDRERCS